MAFSRAQAAPVPGEGWTGALGQAGGISTNRTSITFWGSVGHQLRPFFVRGRNYVDAPILLYPSAENPIRPNIRYQPGLDMQGAFQAGIANQVQTTKTYYQDQQALMLTQMP